MGLTRNQLKAYIAARITDPLNGQITPAVERAVYGTLIDNFLNTEDDDVAQFAPFEANELPADKAQFAGLNLRAVLRLLIVGSGAGTPATPPVITSFTPTSAQAGASVTITGNYFTGASAVSFNNVSAAFSVVSATVITVTVPLTATTGSVRVTVGANTAVSSSIFAVTAPPVSNVGRIVAMYGQSNIQGTGSVASTYDSSLNSPMYQNPYIMNVDPRVLINTGGGVLEPLEFYDYVTAPVNGRANENNEGALFFTYSFEIGIKKAFLEAFTGNEVLTISKAGFGGQPIATFKPSLSAANGGHFEAVLADLLDTRAAVTARGLVPHADLLWAHGENDAGNTNYSAELQEIVDALRTAGGLDATSKLFLMRMDDPTLAAQQNAFVAANAPYASTIEDGTWPRDSADLHLTDIAVYLGGYKDIGNPLFGLQNVYPFPMPPRYTSGGGGGTVDPTAAPAGTNLLDLSSPYIRYTGAFGATLTDLAHGGAVDFCLNGEDREIIGRGYAGGWALVIPTFGGYPSACWVSLNGGAETHLNIASAVDVPSREVYRVAGLDGNVVSEFKVRFEADDNLQGLFDVMQCLPVGATMSAPAPLAAPVVGGGAPGSGSGGASAPGGLFPNPDFLNGLTSYTVVGDASRVTVVDGVLTTSGANGAPPVGVRIPVASLTSALVEGGNYVMTTNALEAPGIVATDGSFSDVYGTSGVKTKAFVYSAANGGFFDLVFYGVNRVDSWQVSPA